MKLPKRYENAIHFAGFAARFDLEPRDLATLCVLSQRAASAAARECNDPGAPSASPARHRVQEHAAALGFGTDWPGLWPHFTHIETGEQIAALPIL